MKRLVLLLSTLLTAAACAQPGDQAARQPRAATREASTPAAPAADPAVPSTTVPGTATAAAGLPLVVVHKSESCGCCTLWVEHMQEAGFQVEVRNEVDLNPIKERVGVPFGKGSCHTAEIAGYFIEGHVPATDVKRLLAEKPDARGLVVPGMPLGSPGMEVPDGRVQPYTVELVDNEGHTSSFAQH